MWTFIRCREGWLTPKGYLYAQELGQYLAGKYVSNSSVHRLLESSFDASKIWAHATTYHRTTNTLRGILSGMFPNEAATGHPLVAYTVNNTYEYMYSTGSFCPPLKPLYKLQANLTMNACEHSPPQVQMSGMFCSKAN